MSDDAALALDPARMPTYAQVSKKLNQLLLERDKVWCGIPMPLPNSGLVLAPGHPQAAQLAELQAVIDSDIRKASPTAPAPPGDDAEWSTVNTWDGISRGVVGRVVVQRHPDGRTRWFLSPHVIVRNSILFGCFTACAAWDLDAEFAAMDRLQTLVTEHAIKCYMLTGTFLETSPRSGLTYWFRRLRPTVVLTPHKHDNDIRILCALCLHPLAYYAKSWCGAMVPTDDVIAHLVMMRADEHRFWSRANHHHPNTPEAGL